MSTVAALKRETQFLARSRGLRAWMVIVLVLSTLAVWSGLAEVQQQQDTIERLLIADEQDRASELANQDSWGGAAYYSFHLTYDAPSDFAFAAIGQRESLPWKHRVRMLALEGQIYEHDAGNPELALVGRFDFAFLVAFVLPLVLIVLLHDLKASERVAGRIHLLNATAGSDDRLWRWRAGLISAAVALATLVPLIVGGLVSGTSPMTVLGAIVLVLAYVAFWTLVCVWIASWERTAPVILSVLIGGWVLLGTIVPTGSRLVIDGLVPVPAGADILMTQREAVNDAWDLPVQATMEPFSERHPEWTEYVHNGDGFDWPWYYAFQQVGDQKAENLSEAYQQGRLERDRLAGMIALVAPPALVERLLQRLAGTDLRAAIAYENRVRAFHAELRDYFYPLLFGQQTYDASKLDQLPRYHPG